MRLLINMKMGHTHVATKLEAIGMIPYIEQILVTRDHPGPSLPKVKYYCPPRVIRKFSIPAALYRFIQLTALSIIKKPEYIHSYYLFPHGIMAFLAAKLTRCPVGISLVGGAAEVFRKLKPALDVDLNGQPTWTAKLIILLLKLCDIVTVTDSKSRDFLVRNGLKEDQVFVLPHTIASGRCHAEDIPKEYDVISVGRLSEEKHIETALKAISQVKQKGHNRIKLGICGTGPCLEYLMKLTKDLELDHNVEFLGWKDNVQYYFNSARMFILTSEREGSPIALREAMHCGIPPIVSNCGNIPDMLTNGHDSIIIERYDDYEAFADAITLLLNNNDLRERIGANALDTAQANGIEKVKDAWEIILNKISK